MKPETRAKLEASRKNLEAALAKLPPEEQKKILEGLKQWATGRR